MLRSAVTALLAATALTLTACGDAGDPTTASDATPAASTPSATPSADPRTTSRAAVPGPTREPAPADTPAEPAGELADLVIEPGAIGPARVGMTRTEWEPTGLFEDGAAVCDVELIRWADAPAGFGVLTDEDASLVQLSVSVPGPRTAHGGIEVGSTYGELEQAYPDLTEPVADGWDQASVYPPGEEDGRAYLGFLLGDLPGEVTDATEVTSIAVTGGERPYFQHDC